MARLSFLRNLWRRFRSLRARYQVIIAAVLAVLIIGGITYLRAEHGTDAADTSIRTVRLASVSSLAGNGAGAEAIGTVRSVSEAKILVESSGTVKAVRTSIGAAVPAGFIIAELENAGQSAAVLQAQGAYDAAVASRDATSPADPGTAARTAYRSAYASLDTILTTQVDAFFGEPTATGPHLLIGAGGDADNLSRERANIDAAMITWSKALPSADGRDPETLLTEAESLASRISTFLDRLATAANGRDSRATPEQLASLASARAGVNAQLSGIAGARSAYRTGASASTAGTDAAVKQALGALRGAEANLEKTLVRAPIGGTVNFLPIRTGDYVTAYDHVATVAQNGALEIVAYVAASDRNSLAAGESVKVDGQYDGVITAVAPALDPVTKQVEVRVAVTGENSLVNGQSVRVAFADAAKAPAETAGPLYLPLTAVKLASGARLVFSVDEDSRLVAHEVQIGDVHGDRVEVTTPLDPALVIVTDSRGLSNGEKVNVAPDA